MQIRRVVTGHRDGKSVFASDEVIDGFDVGWGRVWPLWGADGPPRYPSDGTQEAFDGAFPPVGGHRFVVATLAPGDAAEASLAASLPDVMEPDEPGMHTTATIDFEVVIDGEIVLELDDGAEVTLQPFDTVVQNGTRHRWHNRSSAPATYVVFMTGAHHDGI